MTDNEKNDLTRIEDLKEYLHDEDNSELDDLLNDGSQTEEDPSPLEVPSFEPDSNTSAFESSFENSLPAHTDFSLEENFDTSSQKEDEVIKDTNTHSSLPEQNFSFEKSNDDPPPKIAKAVQPEHKTYSSVKFKDIQDFGQNIEPGKITTGGNPPFAILLKNIKYKDDAEDILRIMREYELLNADNEKTYQQGLQNGSLLISQISEFSAIMLAHKFRRFDLTIEFGLSKEIFESKYYDDHPKGLVTKNNLHQNKTDHSLVNNETSAQSIMLSTMTSLQNFEIIKYLDIVTATKTISELELSEFSQISNETPPPSDNQHDFALKLADTYAFLAAELKQKALKKGGNAVIGITYQITPLGPNSTNKKQDEMHYKITCTGNIVLVRDLNVH